ncbi:alpha/beta fold hydrolase [Aquincola sp. S2]|uniref:Alpha/beta fold hydrolase n=1 Tax=Pseudaquabacterium terrae TaxID=2732868 RepID=A0ABX2ENT7_9BURK|nr:alpha/beta fold hydrolase [Aquabacterium terrae]NRF70229.1 alpha/beta fold hydrolase [Aquabacterium terrae]
MNQNSAAGFTAAAPPSIGLFGIEPWRALYEYVGMRLMDQDKMPPGDGHPVVMFPGLASDRHALMPLRKCCESLGYTVYDWEQGFNTGPPAAIEPWLGALADHVRSIARRHGGRRASLLGWSLGGVYAREVAKLAPRCTRHVITLGTPFAGTGRENNVAWIYRLLNGERPMIDEALAARLRTNPPVPTTSIYSRTDGIVAWQACLLEEADQAENVEVDGSHVGLGWNAAVLRIVADRLAQREGAWQRWSGAGAAGHGCPS